MDELLFNCANRRRLLPSLLQLFVHKLAVPAATEDGAAVFQLRRYSNESIGVSCDAKTTN